MVPQGYAETVLHTIPTTEIEDLSPLLNGVTLATRAPLFAQGKCDAIWRLFSWHYYWVYETDPYSIKK